MTDELDSVRHTAALARLAIGPEEEQRLAGQFARILEAFQVLSQLDVEGVSETTGAARHKNVLREDEPRPSSAREPLLANAPEREGGFYKVPKTVGGPS